jgi:hypothetical protein
MVGEHKDWRTEFARYIEAHGQMRGLDPEIVHQLHGGHEREVSITISLLRAALEGVEQARLAGAAAERDRGLSAVANALDSGTPDELSARDRIEIEIVTGGQPHAAGSAAEVLAHSLKETRTELETAKAELARYRARYHETAAKLGDAKSRVLEVLRERDASLAELASLPHPEVVAALVGGAHEGVRAALAAESLDDPAVCARRLQRSQATVAAIRKHGLGPRGAL